MESNENVLEAMTILDSVIYLMDENDNGDLPLKVDVGTVTRSLISQAKSKLESTSNTL